MYQGYLTNTPLEEAVTGWLAWLRQAGARAGDEILPTALARGRTTAAAVYARSNVPHYHACAMDGIALTAARTFGATETTPVTLTAGEFVRVDTGDPLPAGCDAVVMIEDVVSAGPAVRLYQAALPWQHVRQIGEDFCACDMLLPTGSLLTPVALGALLAAGVRDVSVRRRPVTGIIPTGDELVGPDAQPAAGEIIEFNSTILAGTLQEWGADPLILPIVPDRADTLEAAVRQALDRCDIVLVNAGSSAGRDDRTAEIIARTGAVYCHGLAIRPGKPTILGRSGAKPVIGIPGYPVSALIVLEQVVRPLLRDLGGLCLPSRPQLTARLSRAIVSSLKYQEFIRVRLARIGADWIATPLDRGAGAVNSFLKADGLLVIPRESEGLPAAAVSPVALLRPEPEILNALSVIGSHDPLIDELSDLMRRAYGPDCSISSAHQGSMAGLMAIRRHDAHLAGIHLLDEATGQYNVPYLERYFPQGGAILVRGVRRSQGLMLPPGNPARVASLQDVARAGLAYVNRQKGSGTRLLCDELLRRAGLNSAALRGYDREEYTHSAVATLIRAGSADAGLGIYAAAQLFGLDFVPLADESYDFLIDRLAWSSEPVQRFLHLLRSSDFAARVQTLGGYGLDNPGAVIWGQVPEVQS